jgi:hypothetical protein
MDEGTILVYCCPLLSDPLPTLSVQLCTVYTDNVCDWVEGMLNCAVEHILQ